MPELQTVYSRSIYQSCRSCKDQAGGDVNLAGVTYPWSPGDHAASVCCLSGTYSEHWWGSKGRGVLWRALPGSWQRLSRMKCHAVCHSVLSTDLTTGWPAHLKLSSREVPSIIPYDMGNWLSVCRSDWVWNWEGWQIRSITSSSSVVSWASSVPAPGQGWGLWRQLDLRSDIGP